MVADGVVVVVAWLFVVSSVATVELIVEAARAGFE